MSGEINEEILRVYLNDYIHLNDELPNVCSRLISRMIECDRESNKLLDKLEILNDKYNLDVGRSNNDADEYYCVKADKYLIKLRSLCDEKLTLSKNMLNIIAVKDRELLDDYAAILLAKRDQPFTYGTRTGRLWHTFQS